MEFNRPTRILPIIVFSQFTGTSLWFAGNAVLPEIQQLYGYQPQALAQITSSIQFGFIIGTLIFAFLNISDRFSAVNVFLGCSLLGALFTLLMIVLIDKVLLVLLFRFMTGFFLAGIYPVGMKIAASWYPRGLGKALGFLVGALVLGTAFPHFLKSFGSLMSWEGVLFIVSTLAILGGFILKIFVSNGPFLGKAGKFDPSALVRIFKSANFRSAAFGYFGHMWELYAFWAFIPFIFQAYNNYHGTSLNIPLWSFLIVASGFLGCSLGGIISLKTGSAKVAFFNLSISGICCLISPLLFLAGPVLFILGFIIWGITVVGDSPQFSSLAAQTAPREYVGTGLTIVNSIGFSITIISIQLCSLMTVLVDPQYLLIILLPGPIFGLFSIFRLVKEKIVV